VLVVKRKTDSINFISFESLSNEVQMKKKIRLLVLFCCFVCPLVVFASPSKRTIQIFTTGQGLPDNTINDIQKDADGFLWIATNKGIARFDGKNFISFSKQNRPLFFDDDVVNEIKIVDNSVFLISKKKGVKILDRKHFSISNHSASSLRSFFIEGNEAIVLNEKSEIVLYNGNKIKKRRSFFKYDPANAIRYQNSIYILTANSGVLKCNATSLATEAIIPGEFIYMYGKLIASKKYGLVYATGNKVFVLQNNRFVFHPLLKEKLGITNYYENPFGNPYYISRSKNVFAFEGNTFVNHPIVSVKNPELRKLYFVSADCYYLATNQGLIRVAKSKEYISTIDDNPLVGNDMIRIRRKIIPTNATTTYFFGHPQIVVSTNGKLKNIATENYSMYDGVLLGNKVYCTTDSYGTNVFDLNSQKITKLKFDGLPENEFFFAIEKVNNEEIIMGGTNKIVVFNTQNKKTTTIPCPNSKIYSITKDNYLFWIGTDRGLRCAQYKNEKWQWIRIPNTYTKSIRDICIESKSNKIWLGTEEDGLLILDPNSFNYVQKKSATLKTIAAIINDQKGHVAVSTFNGIVIFDLNKNNSYELTQKNGLSNMEFNYKSAALLPDGKVLFGGLNGYDQISFEQLEKNVAKSPQIHITGFQKNTTIGQQALAFENYNNQPYVAFNTGKEELTLLVSDLDITGSYNSYFTYKIDQEKALPVYNNSITISNLPYGQHRLMINLYDDFGNLKTSKKITVDAIVPFYYHLSFYVILSLFFMLLAGTTIYTVLKARKTEAVVKEQIAMDLHDEVGTVLTRMLLTVSSKKEIKQQHAELKLGITEALFSIRTSIYALSNTPKTLEDLIDDTKEFLKKEFSNSTIRYQINHEKEIPAFKLKPEVFRDCKLILFEATANALKYSNAQCFSIDFDCDKQLKITITDDGKLVHLEDIYNKGNGIGNISKRAERNNGTCEFSINKTSGLQITIAFKWT
jgi:hypothetical protein